MPAPRVLATPYRRGVALIVVVTLLWRAWTVSRWTWQDDDWVYLADASTMPLHDYMLQLYHGHFMPGEFLVMWVMTRVAPLDHSVAVVLTAIAAAGVVVLWSRALARLAGERTWVLVPLSLLALTPLLVRPTLWWASALQVLPLQACLAWGVLAAATIARTPTRRGAVQVVAALAVALFFWEKAVLLVAPLAMVLVSAHGGLLVERIRRHRATLVALVAVAASYVVMYVLLGRGNAEQDELGVNLSSPPSAAETWEFFRSGVGNLLAPGAVGGPWGSLPAASQPFAQAASAVQLGASVLLGVAVVVLLLTRRQSWVPLATAAAYVLVSWTLVLLSSRFVNLGTLAVNDERYTVDAFAVVVLAIVLAIVRPRRTRTGDRAAATPAPAPVVPVVLLGAVVASLVVGNVLAVQRIGTHPGRPWVENLRAEVLRLDARPPDELPLVLWDGLAPDTVLQPVWWADDAKISRMLVAFPDEVAFRIPAARLHQVGADGTLVPVAISRLATSEPGVDPDCGYSVEPGGSASIGMSAALFHWGWGLEVTAFSAEGSELVVELPGSDVDVTLPAGLQTRAVQVDGEIPDTIQVSVPGDAPGPVCIADLHVGEPEPITE